MRRCASVKHRLKMRLAYVGFFFFFFFLPSLSSLPSSPLQFTGRVFSNGGGTAFPFLPYIIYARRREAALPFARVSAAPHAHMAAPCAPLSSDNHFKKLHGCVRSRVHAARTRISSFRSTLLIWQLIFFLIGAD